ncbi:MAG: hypothetical protein ABR971_08770 [Acidobacteriaceae bacterium]|jgi:hypothetical protein
MLKRRWRFFGKLRSDEGCWITYGNKSVRYHDERGEFELGFEDDWLFPDILQKSGYPIKLTDFEKTQILDRVLDGLRSDGHDAKLFPRTEPGENS